MAKTSGKSSAVAGRKRKYGDISTDEIVAAALAILKRNDASGLSMRTLATELNLSPMAVYYYVPNKEALVHLVMDKVYSSIGVANTSGTPEERLHAIFWQALDLTRQYPGLALYTAVGSEGKELKRVLKELRELFRTAGYSERYTDAGFLLVALFQFGAMMLDTGFGTGLASGSGRGAIRQNLDDGLSLIFAGLKSFGDKEHSEKQNDAKRVGESPEEAKSSVRKRAANR